MVLGKLWPARRPTAKKQPAPAPVPRGPAVLFVCTANVNRSPMAAALFRARLQREQPDCQDWQVDSAGTWALEGSPAAPHARQAMERRGLDISAHRARTVTASMLAGYDLILVMEPGQKEALQIEFPDVAERVFLLSEMEGQQAMVEDPRGGQLEAFEETARVIDQMLERGMRKIVALCSAKHKP